MGDKGSRDTKDDESAKVHGEIERKRLMHRAPDLLRPWRLMSAECYWAASPGAEVGRTYDEATGAFQGFEGWNPFEDVLAVLHSCIDFSRYMTELDRSSIIYKSVFAVGHLDQMTPDTLLAEINRRERDFWRQDERRFVLTTSIWVRPPNPLANASISGHRITSGALLPRRFVRGHAKVAKWGGNDIFGELPIGGQ